MRNICLGLAIQTKWYKRVIEVIDKVVDILMHGPSNVVGELEFGGIQFRLEEASFVRFVGKIQ